MRALGVAGVVLGLLVGAGGVIAFGAYQQRQQAELAAEALDARRQELRSHCAEIIDGVEARAAAQLDAIGGESAPWRERAELLMIDGGEFAVVGEMRHGEAHWPASYAAIGDYVIAEYDRYSRPALNDMRRQAAMRGESICVLYS